jgi:hypothetical protein
VPERSGAELYKALERRVNGLTLACREAERAARRGALRAQQVDLLFEATFLKLAIYFEGFQEGVFFSSLLGRAELKSVGPFMTFRSRREAERLVLATERTPFMSWGRPKDVLERADRFLRGGRPFSRLERRDSDLDLLKTVSVVRNAIAHDSGPARRAFRNLLSPSATTSRRPGAYLRQAVGPSTRHHVLCRDVLRLAKALSAPTEVAALAFLREERPYKAGDRAPRGEYTCMVCNRVVRLMQQGSLPGCGACPQERCLTCGRGKPSSFVRR